MANEFNGHSDVNDGVQSTAVKNQGKRKRDESPYLKARSKAVNIFRNQLDKSIETKRQCLDRALNKTISGAYTKSRFLSEFKTKVDNLLDSRRFEKDCKKRNLSPFNAATHIVFDGASKVELVRKNGLYEEYFDRLTELVDPIFTESELEKASTVKSAETKQAE
jgi:spore germination protein GerM